MIYSTLYKCTPSVAQHTLRGIADSIEHYSSMGFELINIKVEKDLTVPDGLLLITLLYEDKDERALGKLL
jgi:hypothetical protein